MKPIIPMPAHAHRCNICRAPAEVSWPVRNSPHCKRCIAEARAFITESAGRHPKFGGDERRGEGVSVLAVGGGIALLVEP
jgi:hypothetical protein